jgi:hypothetical protein
VEDVHNDVGDHDERGGDKDGSFYHRSILTDDGLDHRPSKPGKLEDHLRDNGSAEHCGKVDTELDHERRDRRTQRVAVGDPRLRDSPGPRRCDVLLAQDVAQRAAPEPHVGGGRHERQRDPGKDQAVRPLEWIFLKWRTMDDTGAALPYEYPRLP